MSTDPLGLIGQILHGQFRVDELIEDGQRGIVYRGQHLMLEAPIAIKCMKPPPGIAPDHFIRRFRHESRLHYKLSQASPAIVRVLASGTAVSPATGDLCPFTVLEWLEGKSLAEDFAERRAKGMRGRTLVEAMRLLDPAIEALAMAHAHGVVHREVTPDRLFLAQTPEGARLKVLDFGVAKILTTQAFDVPAPSQSMGLAPIGSPWYAAPEQFSASAGTVGPWTDVYSAVIVLLEALRDRPVLDENGPPMAMKVLDAVHRPTPRSLGILVGDHVEQVLARAVAVSPAERPQDAGELWGMLKNAAHRDDDAIRVAAAKPTAQGPQIAQAARAIPRPAQPVAMPQPVPHDLAVTVPVAMPSAMAVSMALPETPPVGAAALLASVPAARAPARQNSLNSTNVMPPRAPHASPVPSSETPPMRADDDDDTVGSVPPSQRTVVIPHDEIQRMSLESMVAAAPITERGELFVGDEGADIAHQETMIAEPDADKVYGRPAGHAWSETMDSSSTQLSAGLTRPVGQIRIDSGVSSDATASSADRTIESVPLRHLPEAHLLEGGADHGVVSSTPPGTALLPIHVRGPSAPPPNANANQGAAGSPFYSAGGYAPGGQGQLGPAPGGSPAYPFIVPRQSAPPAVAPQPPARTSGVFIAVAVFVVLAVVGVALAIYMSKLRGH